VSFVALSALAGLMATVGVTPAIAIVGVAASSSVGFFQSLPSYIEVGDLPERNEIYAYRDGQPVHLATVFDQNRQELRYEDISDHLKHAAIDGEDRRFWEHGGVDTTALARAAAGLVFRGSDDAGGASTLTMQLVRNILTLEAQNRATPAERQAAVRAATERTPERKLAEIKYAISLAKKYTKQEILAAYLNIAYFGRGAYGVQAASQLYFGKDASAVTPSEAASLVAIVQWPEARNLGSPAGYDKNTARRDVILKSMHAEGHLNADDLQASLDTPVAGTVHLTEPRQGCTAAEGVGSEWFCDYAVRAVQQMRQLGATDDERKRAWRTGGYTIQTTLDLGANERQKELVDRSAPKTESRFSLGGVLNSVEAGTGRILTMVQNKDHDPRPACGSDGADPTDCSAPTHTGINLSVDQQDGGGAGFQTGSTFKMFTLLQWLADGNSVADTVDATPRWISRYELCGASSPVVPGWKPKNDTPTSGRMSVAQAAARSVNAAFVDMAQDLDYCDIRDTAQSLGVHLGAPRNTLASYGDESTNDTTTELLMTPSAVLGTNTVAPLTMAAAFAGVAADGVFCRPIAIDQVTTADGRELGGQDRTCSQAVDSDVARTAVQTLQRVFTAGTAVGGATPDGIPAFGKTGTTDGAEHIWLVGSTSKVATAAWLGNITGTQSLRKMGAGNGTGATYALARTSLWRNAQAAVNATHPGAAFPTH
jgi:membrane peptidoglycan carboxypeptidase